MLIELYNYNPIKLIKVGIGRQTDLKLLRVGVPAFSGQLEIIKDSWFCIFK